MSSFTFPTAYRRYVERVMADTMAEVARDVERRNDRDATARGLATVPGDYVDEDREGRFMVVVGPPQSTLGALPEYGKDLSRGTYNDEGEGRET